VARSNIHLLGKFGCRFTLCGPAMWVPRELEKIAPGTAIRCVYRIEEALEGAHVIIMLRVQTERLDDPPLSANDYILLYQLNAERLRRANRDAIVLHPALSTEASKSPRKSPTGRSRVCSNRSPTGWRFAWLFSIC